MSIERIAPYDQGQSHPKFRITLKSGEGVEFSPSPLFGTYGSEGEETQAAERIAFLMEEGIEKGIFTPGDHFSSDPDAFQWQLEEKQRVKDNLAACYASGFQFDTDDFLYCGPYRAQWVDLGEGHEGEYDEEDPEDEPILRFDVEEKRVWEEGGEAEYRAVDGQDCSYCTGGVNADTVTSEQKRRGLCRIMAVVIDYLERGKDPDRACQALSWMGNEDLQSHVISTEEQTHLEIEFASVEGWLEARNMKVTSLDSVA